MQRLHDIQTCACRLVLERGYDGFTMDELAEKVGVSRRTLFNYVPDKASAVLGPFDPDDERSRRVLAVFRDGGPTGGLVRDLHHAIEAVTDAADELDHVTSQHHALVEATITADSKVFALVSERFEQVTATLERAVVEREGWPDGDLRARVLAATTLTLIKVTLNELSAHSGAGRFDFKSTFRRVVEAQDALTASSPTGRSAPSTPSARSRDAGPSA